jgi:hypothetical protein
MLNIVHVSHTYINMKLNVIETLGLIDFDGININEHEQMTNAFKIYIVINIYCIIIAPQW